MNAVDPWRTWANILFEGSSCRMLLSQGSTAGLLSLRSTLG